MTLNMRQHLALASAIIFNFELGQAIRFWLNAFFPLLITLYHSATLSFDPLTLKVCGRSRITWYIYEGRSKSSDTDTVSYKILSLLNIVSCYWNALVQHFSKALDSVIEELLFLVFQPAICRAIRIWMANTVGDGVVQSRHFGWQPVLELTLWAGALSW